MELTDFLAIATMIVSVLLTGLVVLQLRGTGFGAALGGQDTSFRTRRGLQRSLHRLTILVAIIFIAVSAWSVAAS